jgi:hypothetical protein
VCLINTSLLSVCPHVFPIVARQRHSKNVTANMEELFYASYCMRSISDQRKVKPPVNSCSLLFCLRVCFPALCTPPPQSFNHNDVLVCLSVFPRFPSPLFLPFFMILC